MQFPRTRRPSHVRARLFATALSFLLPVGCLDSAPQEPDDPSSTGNVDIEVAPLRALAARALTIEPGGRLVLELRDPVRRRSWMDSLEWDATRSANLAFHTVPQGGNYLLTGRYRDAQGRFTHADSIAPVSVSVGATTSAHLSLQALIGRLVFAMPSVPTSIDSLGATWLEAGRTRIGRACRGTGGRTMLRLDSLPVGATGIVALRAWNTQGDTLYSLDTSLSVLRDADQSVSLVWRDASANPGVTATVMPGGEISATLRFPGEASPSDRLRFAGIADSGFSDWILLENPGTDTLRGPWTISHGTESATFDAIIPPHGKLTTTRAICAVARASGHSLSGQTSLACEIDLPVSWSTPSALWELHDANGKLVDQILVWDGQNGWPDLNASTARTLRRRAGEANADGMAGRSWCALATAAPSVDCP